MSIFGDSTPDFDAPDTDTVEETAEIQEEITETNEEIEHETTETNEDTDSQEEHSEELLAGKYKTVEQLAEAYKHAQRKISELSQQSKAQPNQQQPQFQQQEQVDYNELFYERFNQDPLGTLEFLVNNVVTQKTAPIHEQREQEVMIKNIESVAKDYKQISTEDGFTSIMQRVSEIANEFGNPKLAQNPSQRVLKMAAQELWGDSKAQLINKAKEQGRQEAEDARRAKQGVNSFAVSKKPNEAPKTEADHIIDGMMAASGKRGLFG